MRTQLEKRALSAYYRAAAQTEGSPNQPGAVDTVEHDGLTYIVLSNVNGILAVYRVRTVNGEPMLKGLKRWPKSLG